MNCPSGFSQGLSCCRGRGAAVPFAGGGRGECFHGGDSLRHSLEPPPSAVPRGIETVYEITIEDFHDRGRYARLIASVAAHNPTDGHWHPPDARVRFTSTRSPTQVWRTPAAGVRCGLSGGVEELPPPDGSGGLC